MNEKLRNLILHTHDRPKGVFVVKQDLIVCWWLALRKNCLRPPFRWASFFSGNCEAIMNTYKKQLIVNNKIKSLVLQNWSEAEIMSSKKTINNE